MATVLIVDDDPAIVEILEAYLRADGHRVETEDHGLAALPLLARADVAVLDWMLPGMSGVDLTAYARQEYPQLPVLLLTARGEEEDRLRGLNAGADDYVVKPFSPREVVARVRALLRRAGVGERIVAGELSLNLPGRTVTLRGQPVTLSRTEFDLLATLAQYPGLIWARERLMERVWGPNYPGVTRVVDVHIASVRRKLGDDPDAPTFIETVRGLGYRFREE
ncbi:DNA-binding response OmpR family regulator [Deinococcus metalli]|uniref:DNA-binding response OmpR family regulator n=1 Tax=Deinococcus metalli TaxID=1141878 RepID=A0A7W8KK76_9DEIO|nr:response regulator transcription factor [Deinococcus metalli]MBB5378481.1 DNA-binding response OmpR family regulator [Deinococcus metalli]GHF58033.1 DNA-binding response regulator [Deinococcus metalli]